MEFSFVKRFTHPFFTGQAKKRTKFNKKKVQGRIGIATAGYKSFNKQVEQDLLEFGKKGDSTVKTSMS